MKHLFLNAELSKLAREKGFKEECLGWYYSNYGAANYKEKDLVLRYIEGKCYTQDHPSNIPAPLYQQIVDWMREEHKLIIHILPFGEGLCGWYVQKTNWMYEFPMDERRLSTGYYKALEEAVKQALNELPNNNR